MKKFMLGACLASLVMVSCNNEKSADATTTGSSDSLTKATPSAPVDSATMMKNWGDYMAVSDVHKMMASWDGNWDCEISSWMDPAAPPTVTNGKTVNKMILGGRYQVSSHAAEMMEMPFEGQSTLAYDNAKKKFISTWIDNLGTGIMKAEGTWDDATKTISFAGKMVDASKNDGSEISFRETFKIVDDKNQLMEMYCTGPDGKEMKSMQIKFVKK